MTSCKQAAFLISKELDTKLSWKESLQLSIHLFLCRHCKQAQEQLKTIHLLAQKLKEQDAHTDVHLTHEQKERLKHILIDIATHSNLTHMDEE